MHSLLRSFIISWISKKSLKWFWSYAPDKSVTERGTHGRRPLLYLPSPSAWQVRGNNKNMFSYVLAQIWLNPWIRLEGIHADVLRNSFTDVQNTWLHPENRYPKIRLSRDTAFPTRVHPRPALPQISLRIRADSSKSSLSAWTPWIFGYPQCALRRGQCGCASWSESSLSAHTIF